MSDDHTNDDLVLREMDGDIALLTIHRPEALNALNPEVIRALGRQIDGAREEGARALIVTGAGEKAFIAGADIKAMADYTVQQGVAFSRLGQQVFAKLADYPGVTIAACNGFTLGGGMEVAMNCDLILADERARFGAPEVNLGLIPGFGGTQRLVRRVGTQRALELTLTARQVGAEEAVRIGLALELVPAGGTVERAREIAAAVLGKGPVAVRLAKEAIYAASEMDLVRGLDLESQRFGVCFSTEDRTEGIAAFMERRKARFTGR